MNLKRKDRFIGSFIGLVAGDALGTTNEFKARGTFPKIDTIVGQGPFELKAGEWTDDTSMALCMAESLIRNKKFIASDIMNNFLKWRDQGFLSSNGRCFDVGITVSQSLNQYQRSNQPFAGSTDESRSGNGSLMRLAPIVLAYSLNPVDLFKVSIDSSRLTHGSKLCLDACKFYAGLIIGALNGETKEMLLSKNYHPFEKNWGETELEKEVSAIALGSYKNKPYDKIKSSGYVIDSLEAALWAFYTSDTFKEGALLCANMGDDSDTVAAIYGQLAGAYYGLQGIPGEWVELLAHKKMLFFYAEELDMLANDLKRNT